MNSRWASLLLSVAAVFLSCPAISHADSVDLSIGGHLYNAYSLQANSAVSEGFTLDQTTLVTSLQLGIEPVDMIGPLDGSFTVTITGAGGTYFQWQEFYPNGFITSSSRTPLPLLLPAGNYTIDYEGGPCGNACYGEVAAIDYYLPASYTQIGGSVQKGYPGGDLGFTLIGETTTPEPGSWALLGTALACIPIRRYWRRVA